jgi:hypothetical protein
MNEQSNKNKQHIAGNTVGKGDPGFNQTEDKRQNTPIRASDESRNDERDRRIKEEEDTERLRSERKSVQESNPD